MQQQPIFDSLVVAMDASLQQMERFMADQPLDVVRSILRRRRRSVSILRTLLRWANRPAALPSGRTSGIGRVTLQNLWQTERNLNELYDAALSDAANCTVDRGLLIAQRAEVDQAFLTLAAEIHSDDSVVYRRNSGTFA